MAEQSGDVLFETTGSRTGIGSTLLMTVVVLGVILSITMAIVAFAVPKAVGTPWLYVGTFVASIALGWWLMRHDNVRIVVRRDGDRLRMTIRGPAANVDCEVPRRCDYWVSFYRFRAKHGGGEAVRYSVRILAERGHKKLGFKLMAGPRGSEPKDWPVREDWLSDGDDVYQCIAIQGLVEALVGKTA